MFNNNQEGGKKSGLLENQERDGWMTLKMIWKNRQRLEKKIDKDKNAWKLVVK